MGRKKGQQQRTKGNVLPSSSVRSADLLNKEGSVRSLPSVALGSIPELSGLDSITDIEFRTVLKKLYKRDVTTKLKALGELSDLCDSHDQHEVLTILPYWPRVYNRLFEDNDRRVREQSQKAMHAIVNSTGKNLALQLKNVMGCWFVSQCDPYAPAAMAADAALNQAFSGEKKLNAFIFCRDEILKCINTYLYGPQARRDKPTEEDTNNCHRIMSSCLGALSLYIITVSKESISNDEIQDIVTNSRFWKFQKHSSHAVRGGYYSVLESLCVVCHGLLENHLTEACKSVFHRLDESNIAVCKPLYAAAVAIVVKFENWHEKVDLHKGVIPGLCSILKSGCHGLWSFVLPTLLPILAKFPNSFDLVLLFTKVTEGIKTCVNHDQVKQSRQGSELAIATYIEVLRLSVGRVSREITESTSRNNAIDMIVEQNIRPLLEECFSEKASKFTNALIFQKISAAVYAWETKCYETRGEDATITKLCDSFWKCAHDITSIYAFKDDSPAGTKSIILFLSELLHFRPVASNNKLKKRSVRFNGGHEEESMSGSTSAESAAVPPEVCDLIRNKVNKIASECFVNLPWKESKEMLGLYAMSLEKLGSKDLLTQVYDRVTHGKKQDSGDEVALCIEDVLVPEILRIMEVLGDSCDGTTLTVLSDIIFHGIRHCQKVGSFPINLSDLLVGDISSKTSLIFLNLLLSLTTSAMEDNEIAAWLIDLLKDTSSSVWTILCNLASRISSCHCGTTEKGMFCWNESWNLLKKILSTSISMTNDILTPLCPDEGFLLLSSKLLDNLDIVKSCDECYHTVLQRTASLMLSCAGRSTSGFNSNIWERLMSLSFETFCMNEKSSTNLLECFSDFFSLAINRDPPFCGDYSIHINDYIASRMTWIKQKLLVSAAGCSMIALKNVISCIETICSCIVEETTSVSILVGTLLPVPKEWEAIRYIPSVVENCGMEDRFWNSADERFHKHMFYALAFRDIMIHILETTKEVKPALNWPGNELVLTLGKELAVAAALTKNESSVSDFISLLGEEFTSKLCNELLLNSVQSGSIWPFCVKLFSSSYSSDDFEVALQCFFESCKESRVSLQIYQTMLAVQEILSLEKRCEVLEAINDRFLEKHDGTVAKSEIYLFCLGVGIVSSQDSEDFRKMLYDTAMKWRVENVDMFLLEADFDDCASELLLFNSHVGNLFAMTVQGKPETISEDEWDFIRCVLMSWLENFSNLIDFDITKHASLAPLLKGSCALFAAVNMFMQSSTAKDDPTIPSNLVSEWIDFFSLNINASLVKIFVQLSQKDTPISLLQTLSNCLRNVASESILQCGTLLRPRLSPDSNLPDEIQTIVNTLCELLHESGGGLHQQNLVSINAYQLMSAILGDIAVAGTSSPPDVIANIVKKVSRIIQPIFSISEVRESKARQSEYSGSEEDSDYDDDAYNSIDAFKEGVLDGAQNILTYLLSWRLLIKLTQFIPIGGKPAYIETLLKETHLNMAEDLLPKLFKLMVGKKAHFKTEPKLVSDDSIDLDFIQHVAGSLYRDFLVHMPASARAWFNDLTKAARSRVDKLTSLYVTPVLVEEEFKAVQLTRQRQNVEGMDISARTGVREVHASYKINEIHMEIVVCLSPNHPLGPITVHTEKRAGVVMGQWRYWLLQITTFLQYRNGGIIDGLLLWKDKVDKRFEGLEECMICFSLAHGSSQSLPKLTCKTCKKKYHAECLYKWFDTSNNSTCPLCRSPMIFR